jgi:hypothetical protein
MSEAATHREPTDETPMTPEEIKAAIEAADKDLYAKGLWLMEATVIGPGECSLWVWDWGKTGEGELRNLIWERMGHYRP